MTQNTTDNKTPNVPAARGSSTSILYLKPSSTPGLLAEHGKDTKRWVHGKVKGSRTQSQRNSDGYWRQTQKQPCAAQRSQTQISHDLAVVACCTMQVPLREGLLTQHTTVWISISRAYWRNAYASRSNPAVETINIPSLGKHTRCSTVWFGDHVGCPSISYRRQRN